MKIAILSDTHDNLANVKKAVYWIKKEGIKTIVHCGDISTQDTLDELLKIFPGKILISLGNTDGANLKTRGRTKIWNEFGKIKIDGIKIAFCHFPEAAKELATKGRYNLVFYGHSHKPWEELISSTRFVNPGNLAGLFYRATYATYNTDNNELKLNILSEISL